MGVTKIKKSRAKISENQTTRKVTNSGSVRVRKSLSATKKSSATKRPVPKPANKVTKSVKSAKSTKKNSPPAAASRPVAASKSFQPSRPLVPLPKPLEVSPQPFYEMESRRTSTNAAPQRWSLHHNVFIILALTAVGALALLIVAAYANLTFQYISIYSTADSSILKPVSMTERNFGLDAGTFTISYPTTYEVTANSSEEINWQYTKEPNTTAQLRVHNNESDNIFTWLQANQPDYKNAKVIAPTEAVDAVDGILVEAESAEGFSTYVAYWPYQINLAEKYIIELRVTFDSATENNQRFMADVDTFVSGIVITE